VSFQDRVDIPNIGFSFKEIVLLEESLRRRKKKKKKEIGGRCIMGSSIICNLHHILGR
jgi:hypothetical protein